MIQVAPCGAVTPVREAARAARLEAPRPDRAARTRVKRTRLGPNALLRRRNRTWGTRKCGGLNDAGPASRCHQSPFGAGHPFKAKGPCRTTRSYSASMLRGLTLNDQTIPSERPVFAVRMCLTCHKFRQRGQQVSPIGAKPAAGGPPHGARATARIPPPGPIRLPCPPRIRKEPPTGAALS